MKAEVEKPDLVISDIQMPGMSGMEVLARIRKENPQMAVMMITAYGSEKIAIESMRKGANDYITKPINHEELGARVRENLEKSRLRSEKERFIAMLKESNIRLMRQYEKLDETHRELHKARAKVVQAEKMAALGELGAGAAHELNNPLACVMGFTEAILEDMNNNRVDLNEMRHDLEIILQDTQRCRSIINRVLSFAMAKEPQRVECDVNDIVEGAIPMVERQAKLKNINIIKEYGKDLPKVNVDRDQIIEVFINVISNARKAMPRGGELTIRSWLEDNYVTVEFRDTGIGIEPENISMVFDPFFTTHRPGESVGLGLFVSYGIIKRHKGEIEAKSKGRNKGASFIVKIPV